jgi:hypothetical protein
VKAGLPEEEQGAVVFSVALGPLRVEDLAPGGKSGDAATDYAAALLLRRAVLATLPNSTAAKPPVLDQVLIAGLRDLRPRGMEIAFESTDPINTVGNAFGREDSDADLFDFLEAQRAAFKGARGSRARRAAAARRRRLIVDGMDLIRPPPAKNLPDGDSTSPNLAVDFNVFTPEEAFYKDTLDGALAANITKVVPLIERALNATPGALSMRPTFLSAPFIQTVKVRRSRWAILWEWMQRQKAGPIAAAAALCCCVPLLVVLHRRYQSKASRKRAAKVAAVASERALAHVRGASRFYRLRQKWRRARLKVLALVRLIVLARASSIENAERRSLVEGARAVAYSSKARVAEATAAAAAAPAAGSPPADAPRTSPPSRSSRPARGGPSPPSFSARPFAPMGARAGQRLAPRYENSPYGVPLGGRAARPGASARTGARAGALGGVAEEGGEGEGGGARSGASSPASGGAPSPSRLGRAGAEALRHPRGGGAGAPVSPVPPVSPPFDVSNNLDVDTLVAAPPSRGGSATGGGAPAHRARDNMGSRIPAPRGDLPRMPPPPPARNADSGRSSPAGAQPPSGRGSPAQGSEAPSLPGAAEAFDV